MVDNSIVNLGILLAVISGLMNGVRALFEPLGVGKRLGPLYCGHLPDNAASHDASDRRQDAASPFGGVGVCRNYHAGPGIYLGLGGDSVWAGQAVWRTKEPSFPGRS